MISSSDNALNYHFVPRLHIVLLWIIIAASGVVAPRPLLGVICCCLSHSGHIWISHRDFVKLCH